MDMFSEESICFYLSNSSEVANYKFSKNDYNYKIYKIFNMKLHIANANMDDSSSLSQCDIIYKLQFFTIY